MFGKTIGRKLRNIAILVPLLALTWTVATYFGMYSLEKSQRGLAVAAQISTGVFELTILSQDYIDSPSERATQQLRSKMNSLKRVIHSKDVTYDGPLHFDQLLEEHLLEFEKAFEAIQDHLNVPNKDYMWLQKFETLKMKAAFSAHEASGVAQRYARESERRSQTQRVLIFTLLIFSGALIALAIVLLTLSVRKRIEDSMSNLENGITQLGLGGSPHVSFDGSDEFSAILLEFDSMAKAVEDRYKALIEQLQESTASANRANKAKSDFLANMSHEIRTPLSVIEGYSSLLRDPKYPDKTECVAKIHWNIRHVTKLVDDILDLAKVESGKPELLMEKIDLGEELSILHDSLKEKATQKGIQLRLRCTEVPAHVTTDKVRLEQIFLNIVGNAIKFTEVGEVLVDVTTQEKKLIIDVTDTGIGIPKDQQRKLFSAFSQADPSITRKFGGTGLGLVLSRRLATLLGGNVYLKKSQAGSGSTFTIEIGMEDYDRENRISFDDKYISKKSVPTAPNALPIFKGLKILLAEDNEDLRRLFSFQLRSAGAHVDTAVNGQHAVERFRAGSPYDLVLIDIQMPVMDGYTAAALMRETNTTTPIIACTARVMTEEIKRGEKAGIADYIAKPVSLTALAEVCEKHIAAKQGHSEPPPAEAEQSGYSDLFSDPELADLLQSMVGRIPQYKNELIAAQFEEATTLAKLLHKLKGMFASYGFSQVAEKLSRFEQSVGSLTKTQIRDAVSDITVDLDSIFRSHKLGKTR
jgi:signal transduction histidine kinase/DNA-binding response OmpR family regulator